MLTFFTHVDSMQYRSTFSYKAHRIAAGVGVYAEETAAHGKSFSKRRYKRSATFVALSIGGGHAREMPHLSAGARVALAIDVQVDVRIRREALPAVDLVAEQVLHHRRRSDAFGRAER